VPGGPVAALRFSCRSEQIGLQASRWVRGDRNHQALTQATPAARRESWTTMLNGKENEWLEV
jgi:hypothetical protein